jgi:5-methylcytosine-specific restriction endonuclease McrA
MIKQCEVCGKEFKTCAAVIKNGGGKYCSRKCYNISKKRGMNRTCKICGKTFYVMHSRIKKGYGRFCSIQCNAIYQTGKPKISHVPPIINTCNFCGNEYKAQRHTQKFCSRDCYAKHLSLNIRCENHPLWRGGYNEYYKKRSSCPKIVLSLRMSNAIRHSLKGTKKYRSWVDLVDYNKDQLYKHLLKTMPDGYSWDDFLTGELHIDHIIPISVFNYSLPEHIDFKRCWALENLQLLPAKENMSKKDKLYKPFQASLRI